MRIKKQGLSTRLPLTIEQLKQLKADDLVRLKLTEDEKLKLLEINKTRKEKRDQRSALWKIEQEPMLADLRQVGCSLNSVWDLVNTANKYTEAIPVLLKHLVRPYSDRIREGIARSLAVREARYAWPLLVAEYRKAPMGVGEEGVKLGVKNGLACALAATATDEVMGEMVMLAKDRSHGESRLLLLSALKKSKTDVAKRALTMLASDPALAKEIASWK